MTEEYRISESEAKLFDTLKQGVLSDQEKQVMKQALQEATSQRAMASGSFLDTLRVYFSVRKSGFALATLLLMAFVGVGVGKASEKALPGEVLYTAKTVLYEPVSDIFWHESSVERAKELIVKRVEEADALIRDERFGEKEKRQLEILIDAEVAVLKQQESGFSEAALSAELARVSERVQLTFGADGFAALALIRSREQSLSPQESSDDNKEEDDRDDDDSSQQSAPKMESANRKEGRSASAERERENDDSQESDDDDSDNSGSGSGHDDDDDSEDDSDDDEDDEDEEDEADDDDDDNSGSGSDDEDDDDL
jgi:tRNA splicing endonuclease